MPRWSVAGIATLDAASFRHGGGTMGSREAVVAVTQ
jgi:hypothetical protein